MTFRELPPSEWQRLITDGIQPFCLHGLPDPKHWKFIVAEENGRIIGCSSLYETVHNDWYISPDARRSPSVVQGLWDATHRVLDEFGIEVIHATVLDAQPQVQEMLKRLGYIPAEGTLFLLHVPDAVLNRR